MKLTIIGATGGIGRQLVRQALAADHHVTAVVRRDPDLEATRRLAIERIDIMDPEQLAPHVAGRDAVLSALGPRGRKGSGTVCTDGVRSAITAMNMTGVRRLALISASGLLTEGSSLPVRLFIPVLQFILREHYADLRSMEALVRASDIDWTIARPPRLTDGPRTGTYRQAVERNVHGGNTLARADAADFLLKAIADPTTIRKAIGLGY